MTSERSSARKGRETALELPGADPLLTFDECADELGMARATFWRRVLPYLETVRLSPQRRGVRRSVLERFKRARTIPPARELEEEAAAT